VKCCFSLRGIGVGKISRRRLYWLSSVVVLFSFLYYLIPEPKDNPYMKIYSPQDGGGFTGCEFSGDGKNGSFFRFNMTPEECRLVTYDKGSIQFAVDYPNMKVVRNGWKGNKAPVFFYMEHISMDGFDANRHVAGKEPVSVVDGVESYEVGGFQERKFTGGDGVSVYVSDFTNTVRANRIYKAGLWVFYQYPKELTDVRVVDDFVLNVLGKIMAE